MAEENKKKGFFDGIFDLKFFGVTINPWVALIIGGASYLIPGNLGGTLQPIGALLILLGAIKLIKDYLAKRQGG